ncbi:MAG: RNA polymerase sigma factor [Crocinitomicaceae bacterium]
MSKFQQQKTSSGSKIQDIEKAKAGDRKAIYALYQKYAGAMLNTAFRILNNRADAEDALHDCFIKAMSNLNQFNYQSTFGAWFKRIVVNHSIDALKKKRKVVFLEHEEVPEINDLSEVNIEIEYQLDLLYKALHKLPDGYRTVLSLFLLEGYDHSEISEILDIGVSTSISQLSRAKKKLKSLTIKG